MLPASVSLLVTVLARSHWGVLRHSAQLSHHRLSTTAGPGPAHSVPLAATARPCHAKKGVALSQLAQLVPTGSSPLRHSPAPEHRGGSRDMAVMAEQGSFPRACRQTCSFLPYSWQDEPPMFPAFWKAPRRGGRAATLPFLGSFSPSTPSKNSAQLLSLQKLSSHKSSSAHRGCLLVLPCLLSISFQSRARCATALQKNIGGLLLPS